MYQIGAKYAYVDRFYLLDGRKKNQVEKRGENRALVGQLCGRKCRGDPEGLRRGGREQWQAINGLRRWFQMKGIEVGHTWAKLPV